MSSTDPSFMVLLGHLVHQALDLAVRSLQRQWSNVEKSFMDLQDLQVRQVHQLA
jgi:hypothetical protein